MWGGKLFQSPETFFGSTSSVWSEDLRVLVGVGVQKELREERDLGKIQLFKIENKIEKSLKSTGKKTPHGSQGMESEKGVMWVAFCCLWGGEQQGLKELY